MNDNVQDTQQQPVDTANKNSDVSSAFGQEVEGSSSELSVDDIILGRDTTAPAFGTPDNEGQETTQNELGEDYVPAKNDETRFQYWQSEADRYKNELGNLQQQNSALQQQMVSNQHTTNQQMQQVPVEPKEEFPPAPMKPKKPAHFDRSEAYSDPRSDSATYLDSVEEWRDNISEYNSLKNQYEIARLQEQNEMVEQKRQDNIKRQQAYAQEQEQIASVRNYLANQHNIQGDEANAFMEHMSSTDSLTMDNLVQLWRIQNGNSSQESPAPVQPQTAPSEAFQQTQRAQQVPNPMGVMPSSGNSDPRNTEDQMMDSMVADFKNKNPWG